MFGIHTAVSHSGARQKLSEQSVLTLKIMIVVWAIFVIVLVQFIENPWILAGIFLYEVLP